MSEPAGGDWRRWAPLAGVVGLLGLVIVAAVLSSPRVTRLPFSGTARSPADEVGETPPSIPPAEGSIRPTPGLTAAVPAWIVRLAFAVVILTLATVIVGLLWLLIRDRLRSRQGRLAPPEERAPAPLEDHRQQVRAAVDSGLADLDAEGDARAAVIACWVRLEELAAAVGTRRGIGDTSTDLVVRLLAGHDVSAEVLDRLAGLYREARYATHVVDERMREEARAALRQLRDELTPSRIGEPA